MNRLNKDILKRYTSDNFTAKDERYVREQFNNKETVTELKELLKEDWESDNVDNSSKDLSHVLDAIHQQISVPKRQGKLKRLYKVYSGIAAMLLLPLAILFVIKNLSNDYQQSQNAMTAIHAPKGGKIEFVLPDGTHGWLKGGSQLSYSTAFKQRHVQLQGEAYFDVTHNQEKPFEVLGDISKVVVLGTQFSASMWPQNNTAEVVLESGKVKFVPADTNDATILKPGERLVYLKDANEVTIQTVQTEKHNAWVNGVLAFRGENLKQVAEKLGEWYDVDVELVGDFPADYQFRATFKDEKIEEVLRLIKLTAPISYQIQKQKQLKDGTFTKQKIVLTMRK